MNEEEFDKYWNGCSENESNATKSAYRMNTKEIVEKYPEAQVAFMEWRNKQLGNDYTHDDRRAFIAGFNVGKEEPCTHAPFSPFECSVCGQRYGLATLGSPNFCPKCGSAHVDLCDTCKHPSINHRSAGCDINFHGIPCGCRAPEAEQCLTIK